ncbi:MAG TPA: PTS sugar transporter subunit IIC [Longimicrobium sp.]|nr:PTS sugar transporter subunit IIC [Longimicrobium sp.]
MNEVAGVLVLALVGGVLALDGTSVGQFMLSRPLVACTLAGWIAGSGADGAVIGVVLEALHLAVLPVGAVRYPEAAPASVAAAGVYVASGGGEATLLVAVLFALGWEWAGSASVGWLRHVNVAAAAPEGLDSLDDVERRHLRAIALDFARGVALTGAGLLVLSAIMHLVPLDGFPTGWARLAVGLSAAAALSSALRLFGRRRMAWFVAGVAGGLLLLFLR